MKLYQVENARINDSWYCKDGDTYYAFYLEYLADEPWEGRYDWQHVAYSTSKDLISWENHGTCLAPDKNSWNDIGIATGSVVKHNNKWYMIYSGNSSKVGMSGAGIAVSDDLKTWKRINDGPIITKFALYDFEYEGKPVKVCPLADYYIHPVPINGKYYIFVNSWISGRTLNTRGCQAIFTTKDFTSATPYKIAAVGDCDRMETAQVWQGDDKKWYMYSGYAIVQGPPEANVLEPKVFSLLTGQKGENHILVSDKIDGPYKHLGQLSYPEVPEKGGFYISKVLKDPNNKDVLISNNSIICAMGPYEVKYLNGEIELHYNGNIAKLIK